jgi:hypothetical protein
MRSEARMASSSGAPTRFSACAFAAAVGRPLHVISETLDAFPLSAVATAIELVLRLEAVPDDPAAAVRAPGRHGLDRAFEAVEGFRRAVADDLEGLVVVIAAKIAYGHGPSPDFVP